jgi:hypothetical protein
MVYIYKPHGQEPPLTLELTIMKIAATLSSLLALASVSVAQFDLGASKNAVGIGYSVWHSLAYKQGGTQPPDITQIQAGDGSFKGVGAWHFCMCGFVSLRVHWLTWFGKGAGLPDLTTLGVTVL